ncbi:MAG: DUF1285 domain-containing protein [Spirochaetes bacterium]|jgi:hypothetical protein|nr:DUF1285 domain-containing protein [Spirochaetota bacterium]
MPDDYAEIPDYIRELIDAGELEEIRIDAEGNWSHAGESFQNQRIIDFFNRSIDVTADGIYVIRYGPFVHPIVVEDAPVFITGVRLEGFGDFERVFVTPTTGIEEELDINTLGFRRPGGLYCRVREGRLQAKFRRSPSFQILDRLEESDDTFYITLCGQRIILTEKVEALDQE